SAKNKSKQSEEIYLQRILHRLRTRGSSQLHRHADEVQPEVQRAVRATWKIAADAQVAVSGHLDAVARALAEAGHRDRRGALLIHDMRPAFGGGLRAAGVRLIVEMHEPARRARSEHEMLIGF